MTNPAAYIEFPTGQTLQFITPPEVRFELAGLRGTIVQVAVPLLEFVLLPFAAITTAPGAQILNSDGEALTSGGEDLSW